MSLLRLLGRTFKRVFRKPYVDPRASTTHARERAEMESQLHSGF